MLGIAGCFQAFIQKNHPGTNSSKPKLELPQQFDHLLAGTVHKADQPLHPMQSGSFIGYGP